MRTPPTGTVTFLFTDIEGSTRLWQDHPEQMGLALARHDRLVRDAIEAHDGCVFKTLGDAFCAAFADAPGALAAALEAQRALAAAPWETGTPLLVRMALHTGAAEERDGDYFGRTLNHAARLMAAGHGGQTLLSLAARERIGEALPVSAALRDLGARRLKDLGRPERVYQLLHPSLPADFPPLRSLDNPDLPNNLPQQATSFVGREREIAEVKLFLTRTRLLTLAGPGGAGKTRLSLQTAADLLDQYFDGVWLVELAPLSDGALVPQAAGAVLGVREEPGRTVLQSLVEWLRGKRLLLVLDNCEHLVDACAALADGLLRACPGVRLLTSSREPLNVPGEQVYRVPSLTLPDPERAPTAEALPDYESVRLFVERAQAVQPAFRLTDANAPAVAQVCFHLDGMPLALELAAARVRSLSVEQINDRLDQRFGLLTGGSRAALPRQQTLRALVAWSYDLLTAPERALLNRLSVFAGGWTLEAAEAVGAGDGIADSEVLDLLTALVDKSLAAAEPAGEGTRYRLLETIRRYAEERLAERGATAAVRDSHLSWCVGLAQEAQPRLWGPEQGAWLTRLETEHDNLRAGLAWGGSSPGSAARALHLAGALSGFWYLRGHWSEGRGHLAAALARPGAEGRTRARARALNGLGNLAQYQGDLAAAGPLWEEALAINREIGDRDGEGGNLNQLGLLRASQGDLGAARSLYEQSLVIHRALGDRRSESGNLHQLGRASFSQGDLEAAGAYFEQALEISRGIGDRTGEARSLTSLGMVKGTQGDVDLARALWEESLVINREMGHQGNEAHNLHNLGVVAREQGRLAEARAFFAQNLALSRQLGSVGNILDTVEECVVLVLAEGAPERAARLAGAAQAAREAAGVPLPPEYRDSRARAVSAARAALGDDAFAAAWDAGQTVTLERAVEEALAEDG